MAKMRQDRAIRYDLERHGLPGDVAFYRSLAAGGKPPVLELGCGTGRIALAIADAGIPIVGLDIDAVMLDLARSKATNALNPTWIEADMRSFTLEQRFGLIAVPYRGLQTLASLAECQSTLIRARMHLQPGGRLAFNVANMPAVAELAASMPRAPAVAAWSLLPLHDAQVRAMLNAAGFRAPVLQGGFAGEPFAAHSSEQVWLAKAPVTRLRPANRSDK